MSGAPLSSEQMGETWAAIRDRARPADEAEAESLASVLAPPSRAHIKRLKRDRAAFRDPVIPARGDNERTRLLRRQLDVKNALIAALGGSRTVKSS